MHTVRRADADDLVAIERLYREAMTAATWLPPDARATPEFAGIVRGEVIHVVEAAGGDLAGFVSVYVPDAFIHHLYVAPRFQRLGLASSLLMSLSDWLPMPWRLKCICANTDALAFYAARGWYEIEKGDGSDGPYAVLEYDATA